MRCAKCGSTNITSETQPTRGYNFFGSMVVETQKTYHCMACGAIGDFSSIVMDYETEAMLDIALENNNVAKLQNFKRKYRNFEWVPPAQSNNERPSSGNLTRNVSNDPNFDISYGTLWKYNGLDKSVYIPDGVKEIGFSAFLGALQITSVTIPTSVKKIDDSAFSHLEHLTTVVFERGTYNDKSSIEKFTFDSCRNLASIAIPNGFEVIKEYAFQNCYRLSTVILPNSLRSIEGNAFCFCSSLTSIVIPNSVTSIGDSAFSNCKQMVSVTLSNRLTSIDWWAFKDCMLLSSITIPRSVTYIGSGAFKGCKKLKTIYFEDPCGWSLKSKETTIGPVDEKILSNPKSAAKYLKKRCDDYSLCKKQNGTIKGEEE